MSGTTDVEENAQASAPEIWGRGTSRALRRRILKHDGRILEPDQTPNASQDHADLSQLEQGDLVEAIYEGWSLPGDTGDVGIDTTDLLPQRVAVHDATIELRLPPGLQGALWSHPALGKPAEHTDGGVRVLTWHVVDHASRRVEDGVPKMDRSAAVSFSTAQWTGVARALRETIATLEDHDPEITRVGARRGRRGRRQQGARDGRRHRRRRGQGAARGRPWHAERLRRRHRPRAERDGPDVPVVAQRQPLLARAAQRCASWGSTPICASRKTIPSAPIRPSRLTSGASSTRSSSHTWQDRTCGSTPTSAGPPLPAGRVSPELRGRLSLATDGTVSPLPLLGGGDERDEIDVRLALDEHGDARGTFAVVLRGRDAQELAETLVRIVGAERQRALRDVVLAWLPWANVDDVQLASSEGSWQVSMRAERERERLCAARGRQGLAAAGNRHAALVMAAGARIEPRLDVRDAGRARERARPQHRGPVPRAPAHRAAEGRDRGAHAGPARREGEAGRGFASGDREGSSLEDDFVLGVATGTIPTADYDAFVSVAHAADDGFLATTRVSTP